MASSTSLYELLGIHVGASGREIKAAYRRLARECHPDVVSMNQKEKSANEFIKIHAAYSTLSDPNKRADYDREICGRNRTYLWRSPTCDFSSGVMAAASGYSRNWETDQCW